MDPDALRERILDILEGTRDLGTLSRQGIGNLDAEYGRQHLAQVGQQEEASRATSLPFGRRRR